MIFFVAAALADPPEWLDLDATEGWDKSSEALLDGPTGCWELVGRASWSYDAGHFGTDKGTAAFAGRLVDGTWTGFSIYPLGEVEQKGTEPAPIEYRSERRFVPLMGKMADDALVIGDTDSKVKVSNADPDNVVRAVLEQIGTDVDSRYATWDDAAQGVRYVRDVPLSKSSKPPIADIRTFFPNGGTRPTAYDVQFPDFHTSSMPPVRVRDAEVHLRGRVQDGALVPAAEAYHAKLGILGFQLAFAQTLEYLNAARCPGTAP